MSHRKREQHTFSHSTSHSTPKYMNTGEMYSITFYASSGTRNSTDSTSNIMMTSFLTGIGTMQSFCVCIACTWEWQAKAAASNERSKRQLP